MSSYKSEASSILEELICCGSNQSIPFHEIRTEKRTLICLRKDELHSYETCSVRRGIYELIEGASKKQNFMV